MSNVTLVVIENTNFTQNAATSFLFIQSYGDGGAIWFDKTEGCTLLLKNCIFDSNFLQKSTENINEIRGSAFFINLNNSFI